MNIPRQQFDAIINRNLRPLLQVIGIDVLDGAFKPGFRVALIWVMLTSFILVCLTSIIQSDLENGIQCFTFLAIALQCPVKMYTAVQYRSTYYGRIETCRNIYRAIERSESELLQQQSDKFSNIFCLLLNAHCVIVMSAGLLLLSCPLIAFFAFGMSYVPVLPTSIPWLDTSQVHGYAWNTVFDIYCTFNAVAGIVSSDAGFLILVLHTYLYTILITFNVEQLNKQLRAFDRARNKSERDRKKSCEAMQMAKYLETFLEIIEQHKNYYFFTKDVADLYYYISTAEVYSDGMCLCTLVYVVIEIKSATAYGLFVTVFGKLLLFTMLGMVMQISNDGLYKALMTIDWYRLPCVNSRNMIYVTQIAQHGVPLKAGVVDLDMALFVDILKTVYTVAMILISMEE